MAIPGAGVAPAPGGPHLMRRLLLLTLLLAGCGASTPEPAPEPAANPYAEYSPGVRAFYGDTPPVSDGHAHADIEIEYHQPPNPASAALGEPITLTGTNIGVRLVVTPTEVRPVDGGVVVELELESTGIAVYEAPLRNATLTYAGGAEATAESGGGCTLPEWIRIDVGERAEGCLWFDAAEGGTPERLQLALEVVPVDAGGVWELAAR